MAYFAQICAHIRVRPLNKAELDSNSSSLEVLKCESEKQVRFNPSTLKQYAPATRFSTARGRQNYDQIYEFENTFPPGCSEDDVYQKVAHPMLRSSLDGTSSVIFAYGATGCGKSHTINAIQSRLCVDVMCALEKLQGDVSLVVTYLQVYNEKIIDLLVSLEKQPRSLDIRDSPGRKTVQIAGLSEHTPATAEDLAELITYGNKNRITAATQANSTSSRSHAVLTFQFSKKGTTIPLSTLSIVDLAGNERAQSTNNRGERLYEGANINRSLLALGNCISARALRQRFVPYRDSKLTRILRYSLQGNCQTAVIVCVSPSLLHFDDTKNSLEFGKRAASICRTSQTNGRDIYARQQPSTKKLIEKISELQMWKQEVSMRLMQEIPGLAAQIESYGGVNSISAPDFVSACTKSYLDNMVPQGYYPIQSSSPTKRLRCSVPEFTSH